METHEYAPGRNILSEDGDTYHVQDTLLGGSGNDWLIVTTDRLDSSASLLIQAGQVRDTFFPVEPEEPVDNTPATAAREEAERRANEKQRAKTQAKAEKKAKAKRDKKAAKKAAPAAKKTAAKRTATTKATAKPKGGQEPTVAAPGPAAVSK